MYEDRIFKLEQRFEKISKKLNEMKEKSLETLNLNDERGRVFDEIRRLKRLQWEEENNTIDWDEDER
jgi:hypothetical protein